MVGRVDVDPGRRTGDSLTGWLRRYRGHVTALLLNGLRDYGTARWVGGAVDCEHDARSGDLRFTHPISDKQRSNAGSAGSAGSAGKNCYRCGAERIDAQLGLEPSPDVYVAALLEVFREVWRVLKDEGTCWINLGDSYAAQGGGKAPGQ